MILASLTIKTYNSENQCDIINYTLDVHLNTYIQINYKITKLLPYNMLVHIKKQMHTR